jgi:hypothetical protein
MKKYLALMPLLAIIFSACVIQKIPDGPQKKIYLKPFDNMTVQYTLHGSLTNYLKDELLRESSVKVVDEQEAEYIISGEIFNYELKPMSFDMNNRVESYEEIIDVKLKIKDLINNKIILEEVINGDENFFTSAGNSSETRSNTDLEKDTQNTIIKNMARDIMRKVIYGK